MTLDARRFKLVSIEEMLNEPSPEWRVENLLPAGALSMVYAPQGEFKTFFALDLALSVASGDAFHGRPVKQGPTVYVLGEGRGGLKNRITAWLNEHHVKTVEGAFFVLEAIQFTHQSDVDALRAQIAALSVKPAMLFVDTFARSAVGLNENDAAEVGEWIHAVGVLKDQLDVDVVALHHAQKRNPAKKAKTVRERGSSALVGAMDTVIRLSRDNHVVVVTCEKQKDSEHFEPFTLRAKEVEFSDHSTGGIATSCVLTDSDPVDDFQPVSQELERMLTILTEFTDATGGRRDWLAKTQMKPRTFDRYREKLEELRCIEPLQERGVYRLTEAGRIAIANGLPARGRDNTVAAPLVAATPPPHRGGVATVETNGDKESDACKEVIS